MKLEQQVCSLELAQKLKELGVKQESLFYWTDYQSATFDKGEFIQKFWVAGFNDPLEEDGATYYSAFTVAELISMLQSVAKEDIIVAWSDTNVADHLAQKLCTKLQNSKENAGSGLTH